MSVASHVVEYLLGSGKGRFGIDNPRKSSGTITVDSGTVSDAVFAALVSVFSVQLGSGQTEDFGTALWSARYTRRTSVGRKFGH